MDERMMLKRDTHSSEVYFPVGDVHDASVRYSQAHHRGRCENVSGWHPRKRNGQ